ncbi:MAG TPA: PAS domain-containing sensor histidine kinase [Gemmatimonadaceae bacterium]|nr:PAS domain-containing sensor histidine kinase [Gemmatimonadaceae bacterium]
MDRSERERGDGAPEDGSSAERSTAAGDDTTTSASGAGTRIGKNGLHPRGAPDGAADGSEDRVDSLLIARRSSWFAFALVLVSLLLLAILPMLVHLRTGRMNRYITDVIGPARAFLTDMDGALALEAAGTRGFLLTGEPQYAANFGAARALRDSAVLHFQQIAPQLGPLVTTRAAALADTLQSADTLLDALYAGRVSRTAYTAHLNAQQARFEDVIKASMHLDVMADSISQVRRDDIRSMERAGGILSVFLVGLAVVAAAGVSRLGRRYRGLALRLDGRAREQAALARIARALGEAERTSDVVQTVADSALESSGATGAYVTRLLRAPVASDAEVVASAGRGTPAVGTIVPLGGAPQTALVIPLMDHGVAIGDLVLVHDPVAPRFTPAQIVHANALGDLASAALRRLALLEALGESEQRFRQVAENISEFIWLSDPHITKRYYVSSGYERIWGRTPQSLYENPESAIRNVHPEDRDRVRAQARAGGDPPGNFDLEYRVVRPDGEIRWVRSRGFPVRNERGEVYRIAGITEDITERKVAVPEREQLLARERAARADAEQKQRELVQVTESRARLIRGFTHDVTNPLGAADGSLELLEDSIVGELTPKQMGIVRRSRRSIHIALGLIAHLLELAQAESGQLELRREPVDLCAIARDIGDEFLDQAETHMLSLTLELPDSTPPVENDPARVRQIIANLVSNAVKYTPEGGRVTVRLTQLRDEAEGHEGEWVVVSVIDTGPGISQEQQAMLFREFTRFNPGAAHGSGIGLAISQRVARALGGEIRVQSQPGAGSTFALWLPMRGA